jgi:hypothetical protein
MTRRRWPGHGWLGLVLIALFWPINWGLEGMRAHWGFFPLMLGVVGRPRWDDVQLVTGARSGDVE